MKINELVLKNFRNHINSEAKFSENINVIWGNNGAGKTSILEAISVCSISRSFVSHSDISVLNKNVENYFVSANCINDLSAPYKVNISFNKTLKQISSNAGNKLRPKDIIGEMPLVILSPDNKNITNNSPDFRRQFVNTILSQASKYYLEKLFEFRKILKQRNAILQQLKKKNFDKKSIETTTNFCSNNYEILENWTEYFIKISAEIIQRRNDFIKEFNPLFVSAYEIVSDSKENVNINYMPNGISDFSANIIGNQENKNLEKEEIVKKLTEKSKKLFESEINRGITLFGPQKDEFRIMINDGIAREFASQGQHKSLLIALKFAEFRYFIEKKRETPIILFDDIFSELDNFRIQKVLKLLLESSAQIFITLTNPELIDFKNLTNIDKDLQIKFIKIENGEIM
jgi:DNA replication and repair protein RecF